MVYVKEKVTARDEKYSLLVSLIGCLSDARDAKEALVNILLDDSYRLTSEVKKEIIARIKMTDELLNFIKNQVK